MELLEGKAVPNILLEKKDSNIPVPKPKGPFPKLDSDKMIETLNNNERDKTFKKLYKDEAEKASEIIKFLDQKISENPSMPSDKINIITQLKELYKLREKFFVNKFNNDTGKNKFIDIRLLDDNIYQLEDKLRNQEGSGMFTYQNDFVKLLNLLAQLLTKNRSEKLKMI